MKCCLVILLGMVRLSCLSQPEGKPPRNIVIVTIDGLRWQEVFGGADASLISDPAFVSDTMLTRSRFWGDSPEARRARLMPFFWSVISQHGQLLGNRHFGNKVNVKNIYRISYPGYEELLTGQADIRPLLNLPVYNHQMNVLDYLNGIDAYSGKVVAFCSWNLFPYILNRNQRSFPINSGYEHLDDSTTQGLELVNRVQEFLPKKGNTRDDALTFTAAKIYMEVHHPKVMLLGFGETDEFAHKGHYDLYLQQAAKIDGQIAELWYALQTDPFYRNNTTLLITTDHGRGSRPDKWYTHNFLTKGSGETWLAIMGPDIIAAGEIKEHQQLYTNQLAATVGQLLGVVYRPKHRAGKPSTQWLIGMGKPEFMNSMAVNGQVEKAGN